jgi:hypothetical protein
MVREVSGEISTAHKDELLRLVYHDVRHAARKGVAGCYEGRDG